MTRREYLQHASERMAMALIEKRGPGSDVLDKEMDMADVGIVHMELSVFSAEHEFRQPPMARGVMAGRRMA